MLLDRTEEREALSRLVDSAKSGLSGALVLYGEAGMGKTALLDYAASSAPSLRLLRIAGVEAESEFGFAALHRLLAPLLGDLERLPEPQRDALGSAFGLVTQAPADLFLVGLASLTLLASSAFSQGLLCVVDDAQWVDPESLNVLAFVARRLSAEGIALIFGFRTFDAVSPVLAGIPDLPVAGLPEAAALELLTSTAPARLDVGTAHRIITGTSGCPLALTELAAHLTPEQLVGAEPLSEPIPISLQVEAHFRRTVETLPATTRLLLLVAAAETSGNPGLVRRVARQLGCDRDAEEAAIRQGLIVTEPRVEFRHPLVRSAVYAGASRAERRAVHQTLADSIDRHVEPDRWARHLAATATGPNDGIAAELEAAARQARDRGGYAAEASLLAQAAELTEGSEQRSARLLAASAAALNSGAPHRAQTLLEQARPGLIDPTMLAEAQQLEGRLCHPLHRWAYAPALLLEAAKQFLPSDVGRAREGMLEAFETYHTAQQFTRDIKVADIAEAALATRDGSTPGHLADLLLDGIALDLAGDPEAFEVLRSAGRWLGDGPIPDDEIARWFQCGLFVANELMDDRLHVAWSKRVEGNARQQGALLALQVTLFALTEGNVRNGQFTAAAASFAEALEITAAIGLDVEPFRPLSAMLLAWQGDSQEARAAAKAMIEVGTTFETAVTAILGYRALAILELGAGNYAAAFVAAKQITNEEAIGWRTQVLPLVVEAAVRTGNRDAADSALTELQLRATAAGTPWALGLLMRSQALLADDAEAEALFAGSIAQLEQTLVATDLALAHLSYGQWLRRQRRRIDARTQLRTALNMFASMGAVAFAERARAELLATGEPRVSSHRRASDGPHPARATDRDACLSGRHQSRDCDKALSQCEYR